jgi:hypothetical protein
MVFSLNVKMLILNDEQKVIHHAGAANELVPYWYHFRSGILHK